MAESTNYSVLKDFMERVSSRLGANYRFGVLFGSRARGDARSDSDYDVLVVAGQVDHQLKREVIDIAYDELLETGVDISPIVFSVAEYERHKKIGNPLVAEIERDKVAL